MTQVKERAVEIIQRIPEEKMTFIFNILQNAEKIAEVPINQPAQKNNYQMFQEAVRLVKESHDEDDLLSDEIPRVHFSDRVEL